MLTATEIAGFAGAEIHAGVFIALGGIQIVATTLIIIYAARYKGTSCPVHIPGQPGTQTATGTAPDDMDTARPCPGRAPALPGDHRSAWRKPI